MSRHGVDGVSLSEINRQAGQRNASALQYHFGSKDGLLRALLHPFAEDIRSRRRAAIDDLRARIGDADPTLPDAVAVMVHPMVDYAAEGWRQRGTAAVVAELFSNPSYPLTEFDDILGDRGTEEVTALVVAASPDLPAEVRALRLHGAYLFTNQAVSTWARAVDSGPSGDSAAPLELFRENLVDMVVGVLGAPVAERSLAALDLERRRRRKGA
jgi:AcrR family transcriptional regulator